MNRPVPERSVSTRTLGSSRAPATPLALVTPGVLALLIFLGGCAPAPPADPVQFTVPAGAGFKQVTDTLAAHGLVRAPLIFRAYARIRGEDTSVRAGRYEVPSGTGWGPLLDQLVAGRVITEPLTIPEGFTLRQIADRLARYTQTEPESVHAELLRDDAHELWEVPGPGLEGYLFPDTYLFAPGVPLDRVLRSMVERYRAVWTEERRARAESIGMSEHEVMTLASIVQAEAAHLSEMPTIAGVFHNRLRIGMPLQADPTVQYALGERRSRLLYADIDSVADDPYNTYTRAGLPPGPIGAAGEHAIEAVLSPAAVGYLYFVARPDGTHIFTSSLEEHNRARVEARREWDALEARNRNGG